MDIRKGQRVPKKPRKETIFLVYEGDPLWVIERGTPLWVEGRRVMVRHGERVHTFFDFLVITRLHNDEPILAMVAFYTSRTKARLSYSTQLWRWSSRYAEVLNIPAKEVKKRFYQLRTGMAKPRTDWA